MMQAGVIHSPRAVYLIILHTIIMAVTLIKKSKHACNQKHY